MSDKITKMMLARYPDMTSLHYAVLRGLIDELLGQRDKEWLAELRRWHDEWRKRTNYFRPPLSPCIEYMRQWAKEE